MSKLLGLESERLGSQAVFEQAKKYLPGGVNSAARSFKGLDMIPLVAKRGEGALIFDEDDRSYIDYCQSWGALILGHRPSKVLRALDQQLQKGFGFGMTTEIEASFAEHISNKIPFVEKMRFVSTGTEAVMTALRSARGYTGRSIIIKFDGNYHGHSDSLLAKAGSGVYALPGASSKGVPKELVQNTISLPYNDTKALHEFFSTFRQQEQIAAVILEPIAGNMGVIPAKLEKLAFLRKVTQEIGALLIFDEVISGFRVGPLGAAGLFQIKPDLVTYGKILGGGLPAACVGGKEEVMNVLAPIGEVFQAGTLSGNPLAMAAGLATLKETEEVDFYDSLERKTKALTDAIQDEIRVKDLPMCINQVGSMFTLFIGPKEVATGSDVQQIDQTKFKEFYQKIFSQGIFFPPSPYEACFVTKAHTAEQIRQTMNSILGSLL